MKTSPPLLYFDYMGGGTDCQKKASFKCALNHVGFRAALHSTHPSLLTFHRFYRDADERG